MATVVEGVGVLQRGATRFFTIGCPSTVMLPLVSVRAETFAVRSSPSSRGGAGRKQAVKKKNRNDSKNEAVGEIAIFRR